MPDSRSAAVRTRGRAVEWYPDLEVETIAAGIELVQAANLLAVRSEAIVHRPHGQSWLTFRILFSIWLTEPVNARDLVRMTEVSRQTTSNVLRTMERDGLIERVRDVKDQRLMTIRLTPAGRVLVEELLRDQLAQERRWFDVMSQQELRQLIDLLARVRRSIAKSGQQDTTSPSTGNASSGGHHPKEATRA